MISLIVLFLIALSFILQWTTDRWWLALFIPLFIFLLLASVGSSHEDESWLSPAKVSHAVTGILLILMLNAIGILAARTLKYRRTKEPVLGPRLIKVVAVMLAIYGCYAVVWAIDARQYAGGLVAIAAFVAAIGAFLRKQWSQYVIYALSLYLVVGWFWALWVAIQNGTWVYEGFDRSLISLAPAFMLIFLASTASIVAFRSVRRRT